MPPENKTSFPWTPVEFVGLTALAWIDDNGPRPRIAWSFRAEEMVEPGTRARPARNGTRRRRERGQGRGLMSATALDALDQAAQRLEQVLADAKSAANALDGVSDRLVDAASDLASRADDVRGAVVRARDALASAGA